MDQNDLGPIDLCIIFEKDTNILGIQKACKKVQIYSVSKKHTNILGIQKAVEMTQSIPNIDSN